MKTRNATGLVECQPVAPDGWAATDSSMLPGGQLDGLDLPVDLTL